MAENLVPKVYAAIVRVTESLGKEGISKDRKNVQQGYSFRGIDDVYNALSSALSEAKLCILPEVLERICEERKSSNDKALFYVTVRVKFSLVSAEDGSKVDIITYGEAMDSGDKATNKAMSAAYKYAAMQAFCIPTEGDNDADSTTHTVAPAAKPSTVKPQEKTNLTPHPADNAVVITAEQAKRFYAIASKTGASDEAIKAWMTITYGWTATKQITKDKYEEACTRVVKEVTVQREPGVD